MPQNKDQSNTDDAADAFLGVRCSVSGQRWMKRPFESRIAEGIASRLHVPLKAAEIMAARGVTLDSAEAFYKPSLRDLMPDPSTVLDMDKAAARIVAAMEEGEEIAIFGDYDVDGATSSALLYRFLSAAGGKARIYIPDRMKEGYGPNTAAFLGLHKAGVSLVITVDCGTLSFEPIEAAVKVGLDVIVVDHHKAETRLPPAVAVVNPNRLDESNELTQLAAVGVSFMVAVAVNRLLRDRGWFDKGHHAPNLLSLLDLVALGTVCDVVPLTGLNRAFVAQGLKIMAKRQTIGLTALSDVGRIDEAPTAYHAGFVLGPRVNAGGRVGRSDLGATLLTTEDWAEARKIAEELDQHNNDRKVIEAGVQEAALAQVQAKYGPEGIPSTLVFAAGEGWHPGVIGIVASRLKEKYNRPAFVLGIVDGEAKGSGRSISGVDLGSAVIEAASQGVITKGGGHAMAAGLSVEPDQIEALEAFLIKELAKQVEIASRDPVLVLDGDIAPGGMTPALIEKLDQVGPFGVGNPGPKFALRDVTVTGADVVGQDHVRAFFKGKDGASVKGMAFRSLDTDIGQALLTGIGKQFHVAGKLKRNEWGGRVSAEIMIEDVARLG